MKVNVLVHCIGKALITHVLMFCCSFRRLSVIRTHREAKLYASALIWPGVLLDVELEVRTVTTHPSTFLSNQLLQPYINYFTREPDLFFSRH